MILFLFGLLIGAFLGVVWERWNERKKCEEVRKAAIRRAQQKG